MKITQKATKLTQRAFWSRLGRKLRTQFLAGIIVIVPIGVTILIFIWIFNAIDNILQPVLRPIIGHMIPGLGFIITIVLTYLAGVIVSNVVGKNLLLYGESLLNRVPVVRHLYTGIKQIMESFSAPGKTGFMQVVLTEFPRKGMKSIGFVTNEMPGKSGKKLLNVFIPTAPNPTSGFLQIVSEDEVTRTDISVEDALKMVVSAGRVLPKKVKNRLSLED